jgi:adenylate cyclase
MVAVIQAHGGSIDKFLGDGIMATFGAAQPSETYAADALSALDQAMVEARRWREAKQAAGIPCPEVNGAVATGRILFGAVGDETRLEYTVIGEAANLSAKIEQHNKALGVRALTDAETYELALVQGYVPPGIKRRVSEAEVVGIGQPLDLVVLAP